MGTGKTVPTLLNAVMLRQTGEIAGLLVIAPNGVHSNWAREVAKHLPDARIVCYSSRQGLPQRRALADLFTNTNGLRILAMNVEALSHPTSEAVKLCNDYLKTGEMMLVIDESTCIKNPRAKRTRVALALSRLTKYRRILTGSPIADSPFDCWSQLEFLERGCTGMNYFQFMHEHGVYQQVFLGTRSFSKVVSYKRLPELKQLMEKHGTFIAKSECLDLPPKVYETRGIELDLEQTKLYQLVKNDISTMVSGQFLEPINAMAKLQHLHNITIGFVKQPDGTIQWISTSRVDALVELLKEIRHKTIIWCSSRPGIAKIAEVLLLEWGPGSFVEYHGGVDTKYRYDRVTKFQEDPKCYFFLANQETAGYGLDLTAASYEIYFRNNYSLEDRLQSEDRPHRIGQTKSVTIIDLVAPGTADEHVLTALKNKLDIATVIVDFLKQVVAK